MATLFRYPLNAAMFQGDNVGIVDAGDIPAAPDNINGRTAMKLVDGSDEPAATSNSIGIPSSEVWASGSGITFKIHYFGDPAGSGSEVVALQIACEAITEGDAHDMHASGDYFAATQEVIDIVSTGAGNENVATITFTQAQADAVEPGDALRIVLRRDSDGGAAVDDYADSIWVTHIDMFEETV